MLEQVKKAIEFATAMAKDDSHGYDQKFRDGTPDFDCSSLIIASWENAGVDVAGFGATYTANMRDAFIKAGFKDVTKATLLKTGKNLEAGDVLIKEYSHTVMYIGSGNIVHASINEKGSITGGETGDQSGKEICIRTYYNKPWHYVLRYVGDSKPASVTEIAKEVLTGKWGNGAKRVDALTRAGYNAAEVQRAVNKLLK